MNKKLLFLEQYSSSNISLKYSASDKITEGFTKQRIYMNKEFVQENFLQTLVTNDLTAWTDFGGYSQALYFRFSTHHFYLDMPRNGLDSSSCKTGQIHFKNSALKWLAQFLSKLENLFSAG